MAKSDPTRGEQTSTESGLRQAPADTMYEHVYLTGWLSGVLDDGSRRAGLVIDSLSEKQVPDDQGVWTDIRVFDMIQRGWGRISALDGHYKPLDTYEVVVNPDDLTGSVVAVNPASQADVLLPELPDNLNIAWINAARRTSTVDVIAGKFGLQQSPSHAGGSLVELAAQIGLVVAARLPVRWTR